MLFASAENTARNKKKKYEEIIDNFRLVAFVVKTLGPWWEEGKKLIKHIGFSLSNISVNLERRSQRSLNHLTIQGRFD